MSSCRGMQSEGIYLHLIHPNRRLLQECFPCKLGEGALTDTGHHQGAALHRSFDVAFNKTFRTKKINTQKRPNEVKILRCGQY